jgi:hypothetical protein
MREKIYKALTLFFWRRWAARYPVDKMPLGVPGNRDPEHPCDGYEPRKREPGDFAECNGDGHYLCRKCALFVDPNGEEDA